MLAIAEEIGDRIGVIHHGRLLFQGTLPALRERMSNDGGSLEQLFLQMTESEFDPEVEI
jgi:ABC-2 type transport system ATP-binding protein